METMFCQQEIAYLDTKSWWVACNTTPYLIKMGIFKQTILLCICNMKNLWVARIDKPTLLKQKQIYARTMQVSGYGQLISLFGQILSNPETKALYHFYKKTQQILTFKIEKQIEVYPFQWKFQLVSVPSDIPELLCKHILNPTIRTLQAQAKRFEIMKRKMEVLERDLLKRMTEPEKKMYKSVLVEDEEDLKLLVADPKEDQFICDLRIDSMSTKLFNKALELAATKVRHIPENLNRESRGQKVAKVSIYSQPKGQQLINELNMKKQEQKVKKKKKPLDFL